MLYYKKIYRFRKLHIVNVNYDANSRYYPAVQSAIKSALPLSLRLSVSRLSADCLHVILRNHAWL